MRDVQKPVPTPGEKPRSRFLCTHCHSTELEIHSHPTYCFRCKTCGGGTPIELPCRSCQTRTRIRQTQEAWWATCIACGEEELFFLKDES